MEVEGNLLHEFHFLCMVAIVPHEKRYEFASLRVVPVYRSVVLGHRKLETVLLFMALFWGCLSFLYFLCPTKLGLLS